jgi:hypothetical protein
VSASAEKRRCHSADDQLTTTIDFAETYPNRYRTSTMISFDDGPMPSTPRANTRTQ